MLIGVFEKRSYDPEIIDTGDYTPAEYEDFLRDIRWINRWLGDVTALRQTFLREVDRQELREFSVLDVGAGSGELLRVIAKFARRGARKAVLCGLELNARSAQANLEESKDFAEISSIRGNAFSLPFADNAFDYVLCSLFTHHFSDADVVRILSEMRRVARRKIFAIDLHRNPAAYFMYTKFATLVLRGRLSRHDGALSILRSFVPDELKDFGAQAGLKNPVVSKHIPSRLVLSGDSE